ncbi:MAG: hypothetical protein FWH23_06120 [Bacteroidales bacterium]|nr:hypothetical protein [Bacteroidales bacterium]
MKKLALILTFGCFLYACKSDEKIKIVVTPEVVNADFTGIGVEWDPYDEALSWGSELSEQDWGKLYKRLDFMRPRFVRCMINSPFKYYNSATGKYDRDHNIRDLKKLLQYCQDNDIIVMYGEYNPPTWDMKADQRWVDMSVDYLNYLVSDLGFTCIKYFVIFNEPDGNWASTNGDYELWKQMLIRFWEKMKTYPGLTDKVTFAEPDVVMDYRNNASKFDAEGWLKQSAADVDSLIGIYDIHAYPGQYEVRYGTYTDLLNKYRAAVPAGKKIIIGEAGFKYWRTADSLLMKEYLKRCENHPFTKGSDCNMLVYDYFYGLDMAIFCALVMNAGYTGVAAWMLDDAMHSNGDSGKPEDIKLWGMWNILGSEIFNDPTQEEARPWYYAWSLMCRYFPDGCNILKLSIENGKGIFAAAAEKNGKYTLALININDEDKHIHLTMPQALSDLTAYEYSELQIPETESEFEPLKTGEKLGTGNKITVKASSLLLYTGME